MKMVACALEPVAGAAPAEKTAADDSNAKVKSRNLLIRSGDYSRGMTSNNVEGVQLNVAHGLVIGD